MTLDYEDDFEFFRTVIDHFYTTKNEMSFENILEYLKKNPDVPMINWDCELAWKTNQDNMIDNMVI